jgi:restriction system protein
MARGRSPFEELVAELFAIFRRAPWWVGPIVIVVTWVVLRFGVLWLFELLIPDDSKNFARGFIAMGGPILKVFSAFLAVVMIGVWITALIKNSIEARRLDSQEDLASIRDLSWEEFEKLLAELFKREGYDVTLTGPGPDGGVDLVLTKGNKEVLVQAKQWNKRQVGVKIVRELFGVQMARKSDQAIVVTSIGFSPDAVRFAQENKIRLVDGPELERLINKVRKARSEAEPPKSSRQAPEVSAGAKEEVQRSAPNVPVACPVCKSEMVRRVAGKGVSMGQPFWGCPKYPGCRGTRPMLS